MGLLKLWRIWKMIDNDLYGGFIISKNVYRGVPVRYSFREKSSIPQLNGWDLLSEQDDDAYIQNPENFMIINAKTLSELVPQLLEIFEAPYGTDLFWIYEKEVHIGYYDLKAEKEVTIKEILYENIE